MLTTLMFHMEAQRTIDSGTSFKTQAAIHQAHGTTEGHTAHSRRKVLISGTDLIRQLVVSVNRKECGLGLMTKEKEAVGLLGSIQRVLGQQIVCSIRI